VMQEANPTAGLKLAGAAAAKGPEPR